MTTIQKYQDAIDIIQKWLDDHPVSTLNSFYDNPSSFETRTDKIAEQHKLRIAMHRLTYNNQPSPMMQAQNRND